MHRVGDLRLAFYGDDFTGSVDVLLQTLREGWRSRLFLGLPSHAELELAAKQFDAVGVAGIARSLPTDRIEAEVLPVFEALAALNPHLVQYKVCSTADSSPKVGSIGRVIEVAMNVFGDAPVPILFAQPDFGRYTCFGHHFAADDGAVYRLDRQPTMSRHPVTPMHESDLAKHLSEQTTLPIGNLHFIEYTDTAAVAKQLAERNESAVVLDAVNDEHLSFLGRALASRRPTDQTRFVIGSGGLSRGLARALSTSSEAQTNASGALNEDGPTLAVSGSRSPQTFRQVGEALEQGWVEVPLRLDDPSSDTQVAEEALARLASGCSVVVTTGDDADAAGNADLVADLACRLAAVVEASLRDGATRRVIICGGDTSSRIISLLGARSLTIAANPIGNVVVCAVDSPNEWLHGVEVLLKGGQVGPVDLFERIRVLQGKKHGRVSQL